MRILKTGGQSGFFTSRYRERRTGDERRGQTGRRKMIRFDASGGDRRSGFARRGTDTGFRDYED